ncbi:hypothetical protein CRYUN_Cryun05aG0272600 [Craigia yunnanensis]
MKELLRELAKRLKHNNTAYENYHRIFVPEVYPLKASPKEPLRVWINWVAGATIGYAQAVPVFQRKVSFVRKSSLKQMATGAKDCLCFIEVIVHKDDTSKELLKWGSRVSTANSRPPNPRQSIGTAFGMEYY